MDSAVFDPKRDQTLFVQQTELLDLIEDSVIIRDLSHHIIYINDSAERLYGWSIDEAIGRHVEDLAYNEVGQVDRLVAQLLERGSWAGRIAQHRKDGTPITVQARWTLLRYPNGEPRAVFCVHTDVSEQVLLEERLRRSQRLGVVGQLTGGVAHDFNNLLTVILGHAELLADDDTAHQAARRSARMIVAAAEKGAQLTERLLAFSRQQSLTPRVVDVNLLVSELGALIRRTLGTQIAFEHSSREDACLAVIDAVQLETALMNLCFNSRDAMPEGGKLTIETGTICLDDDYASKDGELKAGRYICIALSDTGTGMSEEVRARVFEPFFTTKEVGKGSGLGLSMVYGFLKQSGGHVNVYSAPGLGTTVKLYVPCSVDGAVQAAEAQAARELRAGSERVLMVEDDSMVREQVAGLLEDLGYQVTAVEDAAGAIAMLRAREFDMLFSDVVMPGAMNGFQLAELARREYPGLPILLTSGFAGAAALHRGPEEMNIPLLTKPYRRNDLARMVRTVLDTDR